MTLIQDLRYAVRALGRAPAFSAIAVATLALGIGANTTIFSAVRAVLLRPLPFPDAHELVHGLAIFRSDTGTAYSPPDFQDIRAQNTSLTGLAAVNQQSYALTDAGEPEQVPAADVSGDFFRVLGVAALRGRPLLPADDVEGAPRVATISHRLWSRRFGLDTNIVGRTIRLDGQSYEVVGIMPPGFAFPARAELWTPIAFTAADLATQRGAHYLDVIGRLRPDVPVERAQVEFGAIAARLAAQYPNTNSGTSATVTPLRDAIVGSSRGAMQVLLGAVTLVLVLACVNVANLLLARGVGRGRDLAIRTALGASSARLARSLLVESVVLALAGGVVGLLVAAWGTAAISGLSGTGVPLLDQTRLDGTVLFYALGVAILTGLLFGVLPAWQAARAPDLTRHLKSEGGAVTADRERRRVRRLLVISELALATVLLVGAGLLQKSLGRLLAVDLGLETDGVLTYRLTLPEASYPTPESRSQFVTTLIERLKHTPGVRHAAAVFGLPLTGFSYGISGSHLDGRQLSLDEQNRLSVQVRAVTPDYFTALGIAVRRGRAFADADRAGATPVIIVNEAAARLLWPGADALGHHFTIGTRLGQGRDGERVGGAVVGVVADVRDRSPGQPARPTLYVPHAQRPVGFLGIALKTAGDPLALVRPAQSVLAQLDGQMPMFQVRTLEQLAGNTVATPRLYATLLTLFALTAVLLAVIGVYGVMSFSVARRSRDIGVRIALGATPGGVMRLILDEGARVTAVGLGFGILAAWGLTRVLRTQLYDVEPGDPVVFIAVAALLGVIGVLACYVPARRAMRVDPIVALKSE